MSAYGPFPLLIEGRESMAQRNSVGYRIGKSSHNLMVPAPDLVALIARSVNLEPVRRIRADREHEVQTGLIFQVQAELIDIGGLENVVEPADLEVSLEIFAEVCSIEPHVERRVAVKGDGIAELRRIIVDDRGQGLKRGDDLFVTPEPALGEVGDLKAVLAGRLRVDQAEPKHLGQGEHVFMVAVDEFAAEFRVHARGDAARVRLDATADVVRPLIKRHVESGLGEQVGRVQTGDARAHDRDRNLLVRRARPGGVGRDQTACRACQKATACRSSGIGARASSVFAPGRLKRAAKVGEERRSPVSLHNG